jgi:hypothetical protein
VRNLTHLVLAFALLLPTLGARPCECGACSGKGYVYFWLNRQWIGALCPFCPPFNTAPGPRWRTDDEVRTFCLSEEI